MSNVAQAYRFQVSVPNTPFAQRVIEKLVERFGTGCSAKLARMEGPAKRVLIVTLAKDEPWIESYVKGAADALCECEQA